MNPGVTNLEIFTAADNLFLSGQQPTMSRVHQAVGGKASMGTINKYMRQWWAQAGPRLKGQMDDTLPEPEREALDWIWKKLKTAAETAAAEKLVTERDALDTRTAELDEREDALARRDEIASVRVSELEEANRQLATTAERQQEAMERERESLRNERESMMERLDAAQVAIQSLERDLAKASERADLNERHWLSQLGVERDRSKGLEKELKSLAEQLEKAKNGRATMDQHNIELMKQRDLAFVGMKEVQLELDRVRQELDRAKSGRLRRLRPVRGPLLRP